MSDTRPCPQCRRPCPPAARRCLYCGFKISPRARGEEEGAAPNRHSLPPENQTAPEERRDRARALLAGLGPEAKALMPEDVLAKLEREAQDLDLTVATAEPPERSTTNTDKLASREPIETVTRPEPKKGSAAGPATLGVPPPGATTLGAESGFESVDKALTHGLGRGGGPFGPRDATVRIILLPDSRYHARLEELRDQVHQQLGIDKYTAVQALQKEIPSYLASANELHTAEALVGPLRRVGVRVLLLERHRWLEDARPDRVAHVRADDPSHIRFERLDGTSFQVPRGAIRWAAIGDIYPDGQRPSVQQRKHSERTERRLRKTEGGYQLLDLMRRGTRRPIRIRSDQFDFSFLGADRDLSANLNLRAMLRHLTRDPSNDNLVIPLDENFRRVPHLPGGPIGAPGGLGNSIHRRELEFTEYVLLLDARHHF